MSLLERSSESLARDLARDAEPVRPMPRLRVLLVGVGAAFGVAVLVSAALGQPLPVLAPGVHWGDPAFLMVLVGLLLSAAGAVPGSLAGAVPGRERAARLGRRVALAGACVASAGGVWAVMRADSLAEALPLGSSLGCAGRASALGLVPALFLCVLLSRAYERRPLAGAALASLGALALGALVVHASCADGGPLHVLLGHWVTPFAAALLLALPLSWLVGRPGG